MSITKPRRMHVDRRSTSVVASIVLVTLFGLLGVLAPARAVTPGTNGEIAYIRKTSGALGEIFVMNSDGSQKGNLTGTPGIGESSPAWSPKGLGLAYQGVGSGDRRIFVLNLTSGVSRRVSGGPFADRFPAWSPNGKKIAYRSLRQRATETGLGSADIYVVPARGGTPQLLTSLPGINTDPAWSPDGTKIAFASNSDGNYDLYVMNADGSGVVQLTDDGVGPPAISNRFPTWSPDGTGIAYTSTRLDHNEEIYVMDVSGGFVNPPSTRLTDNLVIDRSPAWSPDGARIAFASRQGGIFDIWTMDASDGGGLAQLTSGTANSTEPSWQSLGGCTIVGTNGANTINGTSGSDVICALGGNDRVDGRGGGDVIYGGPGADVLLGRLGADVIHGGRGNDTITGAGHRDRLFGGYGRDTIHARDGLRDLLDGGPSGDRARVDRALDRRRRIEVLF